MDAEKQTVRGETERWTSFTRNAVNDRLRLPENFFAAVVISAKAYPVDVGDHAAVQKIGKLRGEKIEKVLYRSTAERRSTEDLVPRLVTTNQISWAKRIRLIITMP